MAQEANLARMSPAPPRFFTDGTKTVTAPSGALRLDRLPFWAR